jgi:hypothetical protein
VNAGRILAIDPTHRCHRPPTGRPNGRPMTGSGGRSSIPRVRFYGRRRLLDTRLRGYDNGACGVNPGQKH